MGNNRAQENTIPEEKDCVLSDIASELEEIRVYLGSLSFLLINTDGKPVCRLTSKQTSNSGGHTSNSGGPAAR